MKVNFSQCQKIVIFINIKYRKRIIEFYASKRSIKKNKTKISIKS